MTGPVLQVDDLHLSFAGIRALRAVSFEVNPTSCSPSSAPTAPARPRCSTAFPACTGPSEGMLGFAGRDLVGVKPDRIARAGVARTFQNIELFEHLTVLDNLLLGRHLHVGYGVASALLWLGRARREEVRHRRVVEDIVDFLEIERYRKQPVGILPYGIEAGRARPGPGHGPSCCCWTSPCRA